MTLSPKARTLELVANLRSSAARARAQADKALDDERAAFDADDRPVMAALQATEMICRGQAIAFESAALDVELLALWIPEAT